MVTYPNQRVMIISKEKCDKNFLQIRSEDWMEAFKRLNQTAFGLYLYLADNKDGFELALSPKAIESAIGIPDRSYRRAIKELIENGYIRAVSGNAYEFKTYPFHHTSNVVAPEVLECASGTPDTVSSCHDGTPDTVSSCHDGTPDTVSACNGVIPDNFMPPNDDTPDTMAGDPCHDGRVPLTKWQDTPDTMARETENTNNTDNDTDLKGGIAFELTAEQIRRRNKPYRVGSTHPLFATCLDGCPGRCLRDLTRKEAEDIRDKIDRLVPVDDICAEYDMRQSMITSGFWDTYETVEMLYGENAYPILSSFGK